MAQKRRRQIPVTGLDVKEAEVLPVEEKVEEPQEVVVEPEQAPEPEDEKIVLHFTEKVEVYINGKPYVGTDVEVPSYQVAAEVIRIAREAYGNSIVA